MRQFTLSDRESHILASVLNTAVVRKKDLLTDYIYSETETGVHMKNILNDEIREFESLASKLLKFSE